MQPIVVSPSSNPREFSFSELTEGAIAIDVETTGEGSVESNWLTSEIFCVSLATRTQEWVFWLDDDYEATRLVILGLFSVPSLKKVFHNAKNDIHYLTKTFQLPAELLNWGTIEDTAILGHLLNNLDWKNLEGLAGKYLGAEPWKKETTKLGRKLGGFQHIPRDQMTTYTARDARATIELYHYQMEHLYPEAWSCYELEKQVAAILFGMEQRGIKLDRQQLDQMMDVAGTARDEAAQTLKRALGNEAMNLRSGAQIAQAIEANPEIQITFALTPTGKPSFAKDKVATYALTVPEMALLGKYHKLNDVLDYLVEMRDSSAYDNRVHCQYNQVGAKTFRMSCKRVNLTNIPREDTITGLGIDGMSTVRRLFIPDQTWFSYDFKQIEMVLYAHYAGDPLLREALIAGDVHAQTARLITGKAEVSSFERFAFGKKVNFAVIYCAGGDRLAHEISMAQGSIYPPHKGHWLLDRFYESYPKCKKLQKKVFDRVAERGYIQTLLGRRLYVDQDKAYKGMNYLIQGGGAELLKLAQVRIHEEFPDIQLCVVHDEVNVDSSLTPHEQERIRELMEGCLPLSLPVKADVFSSTQSWGHTGH